MARSITLFTLAGLLALAAPAWAQRGDPAADFVTAQKSRGATAAKVAAELQRTYREPSDRIASLLIGAGYRPAPVLTTMVMDLRFPLASATEDVGRGGASVVESEPDEAQEMAQALADADYSATEVADVLFQLYDADAEEVATVLQAVGYDVYEVVLALTEVFDHDPAANITTLRAIGENCTDAFVGILVGGAFVLWTPALENLVPALYTSGCSMNEVRDALFEGATHPQLAAQLARILQP